MDEQAVHTRESSRAALAVDNERLQREPRARLSEEAALRRVATLVAQRDPEGAGTTIRASVPVAAEPTS